MSSRGKQKSPSATTKTNPVRLKAIEEKAASNEPMARPFDDAHFREWHLANTTHDAVTTDFEWTVMRFQQAFERWVLELGSVTGLGELSYAENVILHVIAMQNRPKTAAAIARQLNRDDIPNIQYCLRKLEKSGFVEKSSDTGTKTAAYDMTSRGSELVAKYAELREEILTTQTNSIDKIDDRLRDATRLISLLTGLYDEAARVTATYSDLE